MDNFTPLRNGLSEHIKDGRLGPYDLGIYSFLHMHADWATGVYRGCALTIAFGFGDPSIKEHVQKSLRRLRDRSYINYRKGDGARGAYSILINKYDPRIGELCGTRLNAWKHGELAKPEYEPKNGHRTVMALSRNGDGTVVAPIQEVQEVKEEKNKTLSLNPGGFDDTLTEIFSYYLEKTSRNSKTYSFTHLRGERGRRRLNECLQKTGGNLENAVALMKLAIDGLFASDWHMGRDPKTNGKRYCEWEKHLFSSYEQMESRWNNVPLESTAPQVKPNGRGQLTAGAA